MSVSIETIRRDLNDLGLAGFRVRASVGFRGVKRWIMSFGPNATVLEPQGLVEEIQNDLAAMTAAYGYRTII